MSVGSAAPPLPRAGTIARLSDHVVAQIAAGEVLQRPVSALKELLDNSIDAGATQISVVVGEAGVKSLQVQDNGCGVQAVDLPLLCARHATSKLQQFEDLQSIGTLGFRGEALASISFVAHVTVTTMTAGQAHGVRATYRDGELLGCEPCAAAMGTSILVEDLFYNLPARQKALSAGGGEYARMLHIVSQYAVFNVDVGFSVRQLGRPPDLQTSASTSQLDTVSKIYGANLAPTLAPLHASSGDETWCQHGMRAPHEMPAFAVQGYINVRGQNPRAALLLRINNRLVQWPALKRAVEAVFASSSTPGSRPFVVLDVQLPHEHVDANLHPTKEQVAILHEEAVIDGICSTARVMLEQHRCAEVRVVPRTGTGNPPRPLDAARVRTDHASQTLPSLVNSPAPVHDGPALVGVRALERCRVALQASVAEDAHEGLTGILKRHVHIGISSGKWFVQHDSDLYMLDLQMVVKEVAYQQALLNIGLLPHIHLAAHMSIVSALHMALEATTSAACGDMQRVHASAEDAADMLMRHAVMLKSNFALSITLDGHLSSVPDLLHGMPPDPARLPNTLLQISTSLAAGETQQHCVIAQALAGLYNAKHATSDALKGVVRLAKHVWIPSKARALDGSVLNITSLRQLYRIFERC